MSPDIALEIGVTRAIVFIREGRPVAARLALELAAYRYQFAMMGAET